MKRASRHSAPVTFESYSKNKFGRAPAEPGWKPLGNFTATGEISGERKRRGPHMMYARPGHFCPELQRAASRETPNDINLPRYFGLPGTQRNSRNRRRERAASYRHLLYVYTCAPLLKLATRGRRWGVQGKLRKPRLENIRHILHVITAYAACNGCDTFLSGILWFARNHSICGMHSGRYISERLSVNVTCRGLKILRPSTQTTHEAHECTRTSLPR